MKTKRYLAIHIVLQGIAIVIETIIHAVIGIIGKGKNAYIVDPEYFFIIKIMKLSL